jgi:predicted permease
MDSLLLIVFCLGLGVFVARAAHPPAGLAQGLNWWVLNIGFSALVLHVVPALKLGWDLWFLVASMWIVFLGAWAFCSMVGVRLGWPRTRIGALILASGVGNTAFVGYPLIEALRGPEAMRLAVVADQGGCFIVLGVGGALVASVYSGRSVSAASIVRRVVTFPAFISLWIGLLVGALGGWPATIDTTLERIGATLVPLALFSVGLQLPLRLRADQFRPLSLALSWKLVLAPALVFAIALLTSVRPDVRAVAVLQSGMAPMVSAAILAEQNNLEPGLVNMALGIGILLSFVTVPIANALLGS